MTLHPMDRTSLQLVTRSSCIRRITGAVGPSRTGQQEAAFEGAAINASQVVIGGQHMESEHRDCL